MSVRAAWLTMLVVAGGVAAVWVALGPGPAAPASGEIYVPAAASLSDALTALGANFERNHGVRVRFDFASTGLLRRKLEAGVSADVFVSASAAHMDALARAGRVQEDTRRDLLRNTLVCVVASDAREVPAAATDLADERLGKIAVGDPGHVPAGMYAKEALTHLGLWDRLAGRLVYCNNVRQALAQVRAGAAGAAVVYRSDAASSRDIRTAFEFPADSHTPIVYPACVLTGAPRPAEAGAFLAYLASARAARVFADNGFDPLAAPAGSGTRPAGAPAVEGEGAGEAIRLSLKVAAVTTGVIVLLGTPLAFWLARRRGPWARLWESLLSLPLVIPPVATGYVLLVLLGPRGPLGKALAAMGVRVTFDWKVVVVAAGAVSLPIFLAVAKTAFLRCDRGLEEAARTLNAGRWRTFLTVTLPLAAPGLMAAAAVSFARAFGEFGATIVLAGNVPGRTQTVPLAMFTDLMAGRESQAWWLVLVSVGVGMVAMVASQLLIARPAASAGGARGAANA